MGLKVNEGVIPRDYLAKAREMCLVVTLGAVTEGYCIQAKDAKLSSVVHRVAPPATYTESAA